MSYPKNTQDTLDVAANKLLESLLVKGRTAFMDNVQWMKVTLRTLETSTNGVSPAFKQSIIDYLETQDQDRIAMWYLFYSSLIDVTASSLPENELPKSMLHINVLMDEHIVTWKKVNHRNEFLWRQCRELDDETKDLMEQIVTIIGIEPKSLNRLKVTHPSTNEILYRV